MYELQALQVHVGTVYVNVYIHVSIMTLIQAYWKSFLKKTVLERNLNDVNIL